MKIRLKRSISKGNFFLLFPVIRSVHSKLEIESFGSFEYLNLLYPGATGGIHNNEEKSIVIYICLPEMGNGPIQNIFWVPIDEILRIPFGKVKLVIST